MCGLSLSKENGPLFGRTISSFGQLEELALLYFNIGTDSNIEVKIKLKLPMLNSIELEQLDKIRKLTLVTPRLQIVKILDCIRSLRLKIVRSSEDLFLRRASEFFR